jgi:hypothetical protein
MIDVHLEDLFEGGNKIPLLPHFDVLKCSIHAGFRTPKCLLLHV